MANQYVLGDLQYEKALKLLHVVPVFGAWSILLGNPNVRESPKISMIWKGCQRGHTDAGV